MVGSDDPSPKEKAEAVVDEEDGESCCDTEKSRHCHYHCGRSRFRGKCHALLIMSIAILVLIAILILIPILILRLQLAAGGLSHFTHGLLLAPELLNDGLVGLMMLVHYDCIGTSMRSPTCPISSWRSSDMSSRRSSNLS